MHRKILSFLISFCLVLSLMPGLALVAFADDPEIDTNSDQSNEVVAVQEEEAVADDSDKADEDNDDIENVDNNEDVENKATSDEETSSGETEDVASKSDEPASEESGKVRSATITEGKSRALNAVINSIETNDLPYTSNGVTVTSISFIGTKATVTVKNNTGVAISDLSHIAYKCYNSSGTVVKSSNLYLENLNAGESCDAVFYITDNTTKVLFSAAVVYKGNNTAGVPTSQYNGISVNTLPYTTSGLTITSISFSGTKTTVKVKNDTGVAISDLSHIAYKCYNSSGTVVKSSNLYLENLNAGENCNAVFYITDNTTKVLFSTAKLYAGNDTSDVPTTQYNGISVNTLPYTASGLQITSISFSGTQATAKVKNDTGTAISDLSHIAYKCYDSNGTVVKSSNLYLENLNAGESCSAVFYITNDTKKILFSAAKVYAGNDVSDVPTTQYNGISVNTLPYTASGLTITSISFSGTSATVIAKNDTGVAISDLSSIAYKCYDNTGTVVRSGNLYLKNLNAEERCKAAFYVTNNTTKVLFSTAKVYAGTATPDVSTSQYNGINVNTLPYTTNGLKIVSVTFTRSGSLTKATVKIRNISGAPLDDLSSIAYKCYDNAGIVVKSSNLYTQNMNACEACTAEFYLETGTTKLLFSTSKLYSGTQTQTNLQSEHEFEVSREDPASCLASGVRYYKCKYCTATKTETIPALGHDMQDIEGTAIPVTCLEDGREPDRQCSRCNLFVTGQVIKTKGHQRVKIPAVKNTCTTDGLTEGEKCSVCEKIFVEQTVIPATGHDFEDSHTVDIAPTCTKEGSQSIHCKNCNEKIEIKAIPALGHKWESGYTIDKQATVNADGSKSIHCSVCNAVKPGTVIAIAKLVPPEIVDLKTVKISKPKAAKKAVTVKWKKVGKKDKKKIQGIEIQYSLDGFKTIAGTKYAKKTKTSLKIKGLQSKKKYWVRIRAYKNAADGKHVSAWKIKTVKVK